MLINIHGEVKYFESRKANQSIWFSFPKYWTGKPLSKVFKNYSDIFLTIHALKKNPVYLLKERERSEHFLSQESIATSYSVLLSLKYTDGSSSKFCSAKTNTSEEYLEEIFFIWMCANVHVWQSKLWFERRNLGPCNCFSSGTDHGKKCT